MKHLSKDWNIGDVVQLKSGGPWMTVSDVWIEADDPDAEVTGVNCKWFPGDNMRGWNNCAEIMEDVHPSMLTKQEVKP